MLRLIEHEALERDFGEPCEIVSEIDQNIVQIAHEMAHLMYNSEGIGLAAPQVGVNKRIIVVDCTEERNDTVYLINPEIQWQSPRNIQSKEGCLSYPGLVLPVSRPDRIKVVALDLDGKKIEFEAGGIYARCIYHEIDHLNGVSFTRRVSRQVRRHLMRKWKQKRDA